MKKLLFLAALVIFAGGTMFSQNYMVVDTEAVFKSIPAYNKAVDDIDAMAKEYQKNIDDAYAQIEQMYNTYMSQKASLSQSAQKSREDTIISNEKKVAEYQESVFGTEGIIAKQQTEKLEPIQKRVKETITNYASKNGFGLVLDISANPSVIYYSPAVNKTDAIIALFK